jgi:hypothetical protein
MPDFPHDVQEAAPDGNAERLLVCGLLRNLVGISRRSPIEVMH